MYTSEESELLNSVNLDGPFYPTGPCLCYVLVTILDAKPTGLLVTTDYYLYRIIASSENPFAFILSNLSKGIDGLH